MDYLSAGALASLFLEAVKQLVRWIGSTWFGLDPAYDFPMWVYSLSLAVLTYVLAPVSELFISGEWMGWFSGGTWQEWLLALGKVVLGVLAGLATYAVSLRPAKAYVKERNA